mmetsp:Transcript_81136/g.175357  ORF Transcript_81136/g.175357 Transcript_81136/m.175357 type:complete len:290 (+) Transcript_81136:2-871(+)
MDGSLNSEDKFAYEMQLEEIQGVVGEINTNIQDYTNEDGMKEIEDTHSNFNEVRTKREEAESGVEHSEEYSQQVHRRNQDKTLAYSRKLDAQIQEYEDIQAFNSDEDDNEETRLKKRIDKMNLKNQQIEEKNRKTQEQITLMENEMKEQKIKQRKEILTKKFEDRKKNNESEMRNLLDDIKKWETDKQPEDDGAKDMQNRNEEDSSIEMQKDLEKHQKHVNDIIEKNDKVNQEEITNITPCDDINANVKTNSSGNNLIRRLREKSLNPPVPNKTSVTNKMVPVVSPNKE